MAEVHSIEIKVDSTQAQTASRNLDKMSGSANGAESALKNLTRAAVGLVALDKLKDAGQAAIKMADAYTEMSSKLRLATGSQEEFNKAQNALFKIAQDNKTALGDTVQLYSRMSVGLKEMGQSQAQTLKMVDAVSKALRISGASTSEASSVITQFGQALGSGVLRGEEFNAVMENGPRLARALADGLGLPIGQLRKLAEQGMLTSDIVVKAIQSQTGALDQEASMLTTTVSQAWTQFENELTQTIGTMNEQSGMTKDLIELMNQLAPLLIEVAKGGMGALSIATDIATKELLGFKGVFGELFDMFPAFLANLDRIKGKTVAEDPEIAKLMKMGQGQATIEEIAGKPAEPVEKKAAKANVALASTGKAAKKAADEAQRAFEATINANVKAAEDAAKLYESQSRTQISRLDLELEKAQELARVETKKAQSQEEKVKIAEQLQAKTVEIINAELALRQSVIDKEAEGTQIKIKGIEDELSSADRLKLSQAERIQLQSELNSLQTEQSLKSEERLQAELDAQKQIQDASKAVTDARLEGETSVREEALRTLEVLSSNLEYSREMATGLADAFGEVGASIGGMTVALAEYEKQQATINIQAEEAIKKNPSKKMEIEAEALNKQSRNQIKLYGDMAQAAQGFFKKGTTGYKAMEGATKAFRAFEMAQSAMSMAKQLDDISRNVISFVTGETTKAAASAATMPTVISTEAGKQIAYSKTAIAAQGQIPVAGFALMAAMAALLAVYGISGGGGGSASTPSLSGTGTVLGDPTKQSESIANSLSLLVDLNTNDLAYSADMLASLKAIEGALSDASALIAKQVMPIIGGIVSQFSSSGMLSSKEVKEAGFLVGGQSLNKVLASGLLQGYMGARVESTTGLLGEFHSGQTMIAKYGSDIAKAFGKIVTELYKTITASAEKIGVPLEEITRRAEGLKVGLGKVNLAGMSAEEAAKAIEAAFSAMSDTMAMRILPEFKDFQRNGEGYFETIVRVGAGVAEATGKLERLGIEAINYTDIVNKTGDVAAEIARQSILVNKEMTDGVKAYVGELTGTIDDIISGYKQLVEIQGLLTAGGFNGEALDRVLINAAGGMDEFQSALEDFNDRFLTDQEKISAEYSRLTKVFLDLGIAMPRTNDDFKKLLNSFDLSTESGKKLFAQVIGLSGAFADLTESLDSQRQAEIDAAKAAADAAQKIQDEMLSGLQKNVDSAFSTMQKAYQDLQKVQERFLTYSKNIRAYLDELTGGRSAYISPEERYRIAKQEFQRISSLVATGDESALAEITKAGKDFLDASREYNASSQQFQDDFASVTGALESSAGYAEAQANLAANQLRIAENSYSALVNINNSTIGVVAGIAVLNTAMASYTSAVNALASAKASASSGGGGGGGVSAGGGTVTFPNGTIVSGSGDVYYNPSAPLGTPTNPIPVPKVPIRMFASGGSMSAGISLVGESGPELISSGGGYVSSAGATANFFKTIKDAVVVTSNEQTALLKEQIGELQALVRLQSAANRELISQLSEIKSETAESTRIAKIEASA